MKGLFGIYIAGKTGSAIGSLIIALVVLSALAIVFVYVAYILLALLAIIGIIALLTGVITATISFIKALIKEIKFVKSEQYTQFNNNSVFLKLSNMKSIERILAYAFQNQHDIFNRVFPSKPILRFFLLFLVQVFGFVTVIILSEAYFLIFGSSALIVSLVRRVRSKPSDISQVA